MSSIRWKTVWITGASSGIGMELARLLDGKVAHVAVSARSRDKLELLASQSKTIVSYPVDVTDAPAMASIAASIEETAGPIDLVVLNAGVWSLMRVDELDLHGVRAGVEVNYMGVMHGLNAVLQSMLARGSGHIAIVGSIAGYRGLFGAVAYGPTKAALINLAETLRCELGPRGIDISIINPGFIDTPMTQDNPFPMPDIISAKDAAQRMLAGLEQKKYEILFPFRFGWMIKSLRYLPNAMYFWVHKTFVSTEKR